MVIVKFAIKWSVGSYDGVVGKGATHSKATQAAMDCVFIKATEMKCGFTILDSTDGIDAYWLAVIQNQWERMERGDYSYIY